MSAGRFVRLSVGLGLLCVLILLVEPGAVVATLARLDSRWLVLAALAILSSTLIGAWNSYMLVARSGELKFLEFLPVFWTGWALSLVVPGQVGDVAGMSALLRRHHMPWHDSIGRSLLDKAISLVVMCGFAGAGLLLIWPPNTGLSIVLLITATAALLGAASLLVFRRLSNHEFQSPIARFVHATLGELVSTAARHPGRVAGNSGLTILKTSLIGLAYWCAFAAAGESGLPVVTVVLLVSASSLVAYIPISINGIGTAEVTGVVLFAMLGIADSAILSAYLVLRAIVFVLAWLPTACWWALAKVHN